MKRTRNSEDARDAFMVHVEILDSDQTRFLLYLEKQHADVYNTISRFRITLDRYEKPRISPWNCEFEVNDISVRLTEEGKPMPDAGGRIRYFVRCVLSHESSLAVIKDFVTKALTYEDPEDTGLVMIYNSKAKQAYWSHGQSIYVQSLDTIFISAGIKAGIINHIDTFIGSAERYRTFGRTHKLSFLLTGVPGSGKSSLIKAIAKHYNRPLYILSLSKHLDDDSLIELMSEIKSDSILLLEDIDAFFIDRETKDINISFSAFINVLDGATAPVNGIIICMTANNPERLDPALVRPGRVDRIVKFDSPQKAEIKEAFNALTMQEANSTTAEAHFAAFYKHVGNLQISMAAIVDFLFRHTADYNDHIDELTTHTKLLHEIANSKNDTMYR